MSRHPHSDLIEDTSNNLSHCDSRIDQNCVNIISLKFAIKQDTFLHCALAAAHVLSECLRRAACVCVCVCVCLWVCYYDNSKLRASILAKLGF